MTNKTTKISKNTIYDIFSKHNAEIDSDLTRLHENLLFLKDGINLVIGESKAGKTFSTIKTLVDCGFKDHVIHIDFDRNADKKLKELGVQTYHINDVRKFLEDLSDEKNVDAIKASLKGKILIIDSLQDISLDDGLDSNAGSLETMKRILGFKETEATIIVIHHVTIDEKNNKMKVKGNASVITSKSDTTIGFIKKTNSKRIMTVLNTRAEDEIPSETSIEITDEGIVLDKLKGQSNVPK